MRKNIFVKSMLRQRTRSAVLVLLIAAAAFAFVMRATEYLIVTEQIEGIGRYFRSIGYLQSMSGSGRFENVYDAVELLKANPHLGLVNEQRYAEGRLDGMLNADINTSNTNNLRFSDAYFYGEVLSIQYVPFFRPPHYDLIEIVVRVDEALNGYPEHIAVGRELTLTYRLVDGELESGLAEVQRMFKLYNAYEGIETEIDNVKTALSDMRVGERYLLRATMSVDALATNEMHPLDETLSIFGRVRAEKPIWFLRAETGEELDLAAYGIDVELERLRYNQSAMWLITASDMTALPDFQPRDSAYTLVDGRWLNGDDEQNARGVAVVHEQFAQMRGLAVGDTITYTVPQEQNAYGFTDTLARGITALVTEGVQDADEVYTLELEIVGLYNVPSLSRLDRVTGITATTGSQITNYVYIPNSVLPTEVHFNYLGEELAAAGISALREYVPESRFSFVLRDSRDEPGFLAEYRAVFEAVGAEVLFLESDAQNFWASAGPILSSAAMNTVIFSIVLVVVLVLVAFLYLRQRRREFAIQRALGVSAVSAFSRLMTSVCVFGLPSVAVGAAAGWAFALRQTAATMNPFGELATYFDFALDLSLPAYYLVALGAGVFAALLIFTLIGAVRLAAWPVLEMLQGGGGARSSSRAAVSPSELDEKQIGVKSERTSDEAGRMFTAARISQSAVREDADARRARSAGVRFVVRHIVRSGAKTLLTALVAVFFVLALGFLHKSIASTQAEIDRLYDTTHVEAVIRPSSNDNALRGNGGLITPITVQRLVESELAAGLYAEAIHEWAIVAPSDGGGGLREDWGEAIGYDTRVPAFSFPSYGMLNRVLAFNDFERFLEVQNAAQLAADRFFEELHFEFAEGFSAADLVPVEGEATPVLLSASTVAARGLTLGEVAYFGEVQIGSRGMPGSLYESRPWRFVPVLVIGSYDDSILTEAEVPIDVLMHTEGLVRMLGRQIGYSRLLFHVDPSRNREIPAVREELYAIKVGDMVNRAGWSVRLTLLVYDESLRTVAGSMDRNLALLLRLYPVAIGLSVIIGLGLALLLMLQNAKNAAIVRILGSTQRRALTVLSAEQMVTCLAGVLLGIAVAALLRWDVGAVCGLAALYFAGATAGSVAGGVLVTNKPPLELLQVRE